MNIWAKCVGVHGGNESRGRFVYTQQFMTDDEDPSHESIIQAVRAWFFPIFNCCNDSLAIKYIQVNYQPPGVFDPDEFTVDWNDPQPDYETIIVPLPWQDCVVLVKSAGNAEEPIRSRMFISPIEALWFNVYGEFIGDFPLSIWRGLKNDLNGFCSDGIMDTGFYPAIWSRKNEQMYRMTQVWFTDHVCVCRSRRGHLH